MPTFDEFLDNPGLLFGASLLASAKTSPNPYADALSTLIQYRGARGLEKQRQAQTDIEKQELELKQAQAQAAQTEQARKQEFLKRLTGGPEAALGAGAQTGDIGPTVTNAARAQAMQSRVPPEVLEAAALYAPQTIPGLLKGPEPTELQRNLQMLPEELRGQAVRQKFLPQQAPPQGYLVQDEQGRWKVDPELYRAATQKAQAGAMQVTLGQPQFFEGPGGQSYAVQAPNRPGQPLQIQPLPTGLKKTEGEKPPTEGQSRNAMHLSEMVNASQDLKGIEGYEPTSKASQAATALAGTPANIAMPETAQQARAAQERWSAAFLYARTGAAATQDEIKKNVMTYFPQVGDAEKVVKQKERARAEAEQALRKATGKIEVEPAKRQQTGKIKFLGFE